MAFLGKGRGREQEPKPQMLDVTASMQGSLVFQEPVNLRISGRFEGQLETRGDLTIGEQAQVAADITGDIITVAGRVSGKIVAKKKLTLVPPAFITAEVWTPLLEVREGARLTGGLHMAQEPLTMTAEEVAEYLEVELRVVEEWARAGKIPGILEGDRWRFEKTKIDEWVAAQKSS